MYVAIAIFVYSIYSQLANSWPQLDIKVFSRMYKYIASQLCSYSQITTASDWPRLFLHPRCFCLAYNNAQVYELAIANNITNTIHCMHIGNVLLESIHLIYSQLFVNSMFALLLQELEWDACKESTVHHLEKRRSYQTVKKSFLVIFYRYHLTWHWL